MEFFAIGFVAAILLAALMGFAIQRGNTCTVAAVDEVINRGQWQRFRSIVEAALWVLAALLAARALGLSMQLPPGFSSGLLSVFGGVLLGAGAYINRGCAFGAVARLGSGDSNYVATLIGFYVGARALAATGVASSPSIAFAEPDREALILVAAPLFAYLTWRCAHSIPKAMAIARKTPGATAARVVTAQIWAPAAATAVIGITFVGLLLLVGAWAYTDALLELSRGSTLMAALRSVLLLALFGGALLGAWSAGRLQWLPPTPSGITRCLCGGALMGAGSAMIPGGNDGLLLANMPLLWPYAWIAFAAMATTIAIAIGSQRLRERHTRLSA